MFPNKTKIPVAAPSKKYQHDLSHSHITTTDYFKFGVNLMIPAVADNKFEMQNRAFTRLMPMAKPAFGQAKVHQRLYFVPFSMIQKSYNDMIADKPHAYDADLNTQFNIPTQFRNCQMGDLIALFIGNPRYSNATTGSTYDFEDRAQVKYLFTPLGRKIYNLLIQLGIKIEFTLATKTNNYVVNIMPLLALTKIFIDYYYTSTYENLLKYKVEQTINSNTIGLEQVTLAQLTEIFTILEETLFYDNDYFTSAWDNPVGPNSLSANQQMNINDNTMYSSVGSPTEDFSIIRDGNNGTPVVKGYDYTNGTEVTTVRNFSQYIDTALKKVTQYVTRNRLVGNRTIDRILSRFGIKLTENELQRSYFIGDYSFDVQFGDVMSNSDTAGAILGEYAGKGIGYGESQKFSFYNKEAGIYLGVFYIVPKIGYYQGINKFALTINKLDFYTPEFDNLGVDAIAQAEVFMPNKFIKNSNNNYYQFQQPTEKIFGYQPRYMWLKTKLDTISGDFMFDSINAGLDVWHLMRTIDMSNYWADPISETIPNIRHTYGFTNAVHDAEQYDRNFASGQSLNDNFYVVNVFKISCFNTMLPAYDTLDYDDLKDHKQLLMNVGGKHPNN